ncbi:MAG: serine protease, partial [Balneolaceae bacterium]
MDKVQLSKKLDETTYRIRAFENEELFSEGSAFCFSHRGLLITAAHVIDGGKPFDVSRFDELNITIEANTKKGPIQLYRPNICGINVDWPTGPLKDNILIDLAVLNPVEPVKNIPFLEIEDVLQPVGTDILMAGFPDELEFPLKLDEKADIKHLKKVQSVKDTNSNLSRLKGMLIMKKSGMIGFSDHLIIDPNLGDGFKLKIGVFYIDNGMHSGASGGPVINSKGKVLGVITKRAVTRVSYPDLENPNKDVPSGSTLAITSKTIIDFSRYMISKNEFQL